MINDVMQNSNSKVAINSNDLKEMFEGIQTIPNALIPRSYLKKQRRSKGPTLTV